MMFTFGWQVKKDLEHTPSPALQREGFGNPNKTKNNNPKLNFFLIAKAKFVGSNLSVYKLMTSEWIKKIKNIHKMEYYSTIKRDEELKHATT